MNATTIVCIVLLFLIWIFSGAYALKTISGANNLKGGWYKWTFFILVVSFGCISLGAVAVMKKDGVVPSKP